MAGLSPQPPVVAGEAAEDDSSRGEGREAAAPPDGEAEPPTVARCEGPDCGLPLLRPGRRYCHGCEQYLATQPATDRERHSA